MSTPPPLALVGAGNMAVEYSRVLTAIDRPHVVLGRGEGSARLFEEATGIRPTTGPLVDQLSALGHGVSTAIVAVNAMHLADVTAELARAGVGRILVEKPAALDSRELTTLLGVVADTGADVYVGYNRRFVESVRTARRMIAQDGGALSVKFDFSEPSRRIATLGKPQRELETWFYGNSSHVVDLALHLADGEVSGDLAISGLTSGAVPWHSAAGVFVGHARTTGGTLVSWHANWIGPGRWGVEVVTVERRLILQPLERLRVQDHNGFDERAVDLDDVLDRDHKPGLLRQVRAFLGDEDDTVLLGLAAHAARWPVYEAIRSGAAAPLQGGADR